jgi:ketosteroid isomerase-like protein
MLRTGILGILLRRTFVSVALPAILASPAFAHTSAPDAAMLKPVQDWIAAYNAGTGPLPEDIFTRDVVITDEFPPFIWTGISGEHHWATGIDGFMKPGQEHVSVGAPRFFQSARSGDRVSFVLPAHLWISRGKRRLDQSALWFYVLVKTASGWKIAADTWTATADTWTTNNRTGR